MPRSRHGSPAVQALLASIGLETLTPRAVERASSDKLGPPVTGNQPPPTDVLDHYRALLPMRTAWGKQKLDKRLLPLFLAVMGQPVLDDYVRSNLVSFLATLFHIPSEDQADDVTESIVSQFAGDYDRARVTYRTSDDEGLALHHRMISDRTRDLLRPLPDEASTFGDFTDPPLPPNQARILAQEETYALLRGVLGHLVGGTPLGDEDESRMLNFAKNLDSRLRGAIEEDDEDELVTFVRNNMPVLPELIRALGQSRIPTSVLDDTRRHVITTSVVGIALSGAPAEYLKLLTDVDTLLVGGFVNAYWFHLQTERGETHRA